MQKHMSAFRKLQSIQGKHKPQVLPPLVKQSAALEKEVKEAEGKEAARLRGTAGSATVLLVQRKFREA